MLLRNSQSNITENKCLSIGNIYYLPSGSGLPTFTNHEVASIGERNRVSVAGRRKVDVAAGLVVLVVVLAADKAGGIVQLEVGKVRDRSRGSEGASSGGKRNGDGGEGNHFD